MNSAITATEYSPEQGLFDLTLLNAENSTSNFDDVVVEGIQRGIPPELLTRLREIWEKTKLIAGELISIGKIIVQQIFTFLKENPKLTLGLALGAVVATFIAGIPVFGPILEPISTIIATLYGAGVGAAMQKGDYSGSPFAAAIELAHKFCELIKKIFNAVVGYWKE